ncbi:outer membrane protein with beta-barrel domain [Gelidibacter algens]|uniref:Outer membrane protein with beta-barrel domain n=2 Tax=Gelidibacter algens TaxID=49280 RepID=A0A327SAB6_9FLAO|nr:outer membrane protein with beta-barrel domain [Gelidibacter algens]
MCGNINYICSMKSSILILVFCGVASTLIAQQPKDSTVVDNRYREDQFYFSLTYNLLGKIPDGLKQSGFSTGVHFGAIRDMPINERRNKAIGIGLGLSTNSYNQNILISQDADGAYMYQVINESEITVKRNKFTTYAIEAPLQYRWRTSTAREYKFWRIYTGLKLGYVFYDTSKFGGSIADIKIKNNNDFEKFQYGLTLSAGYSTWNFHVYYGLNSIFKESAQLNGKVIDMNSIKVGLMFYVL